MRYHARATRYHRHKQLLRQLSAPFHRGIFRPVLRTALLTGGASPNPPAPCSPPWLSGMARIPDKRPGIGGFSRHRPLTLMRAPTLSLDCLRHRRYSHLQFQSFLINGEIGMLFENIARPDDGLIVTYCGGSASTSGATASAVIGYEHMLEYDGSLAKWASDPSLPLEFGLV